VTSLTTRDKVYYYIVAWPVQFDRQSVNQLSCEGGGWKTTACNYTSYIVAGVKCDKDLFSRNDPKIGNHLNLISYRKNFKTVEIAINGCI
jgi:hypothetical protein